MHDNLIKNLKASNLHFPAWLRLNLHLSLWIHRVCVRKPTGILYSLWCVAIAKDPSCVCWKISAVSQLILFCVKGGRLFQYIKCNVGITISRHLDKTKTLKSALKNLFFFGNNRKYPQLFMDKLSESTCQSFQNSGITCITQCGTLKKTVSAFQLRCKFLIYLYFCNSFRCFFYENLLIQAGDLNSTAWTTLIAFTSLLEASCLGLCFVIWLQKWFWHTLTQNHCQPKIHYCYTHFE